mgnify:CR=1 FL=1
MHRGSPVVYLGILGALLLVPLGALLLPFGTLFGHFWDSRGARLGIVFGLFSFLGGLLDLVRDLAAEVSE